MTEPFSNEQMRRGSIPILLYHSVSDAPPPWIRAFSVTPSLFADHLQALRRAGAQPMGVADLLSHLLAPEELPERAVLVTFDDGLRDFYEFALPLLESNSFPAALFVSTGFVDGLATRTIRSRPSGTWLDVDDLYDIAQRGVEVGSHSHSHDHLDLLDERWARVEIELSKRLLEERAGLRIDAFSYPHGYSSATVRALVNDAGYRVAFRVGHDVCRHGDCVLALPRLVATNGTSPQELVGWLVAGHDLHGRAPDATTVRTWRLARRLTRQLPGQRRRTPL